MTYVINPSVTIGGIDFSNEVLNGVQASAGRSNVDEQPRAGFCSISIIDFDANIADVHVDDFIQIKVDDSNGTPTILWSGWVSDISKSVKNYGTTGYVTEARITGIGSLAKLNRRRVGLNGYPKQFDGDRVYDILFETAGITWADVAPSLSWQNVNPLQSWGTYDLLIGDIDQAGDFELQVYSAGEASGLVLAQQAAQSGLGILYEARDGGINYDDFTARLDRVALDGFTDIDLDAIIATSLSSISRLADLANNVEVVYKNGQVETGSDANSKALYGDWEVRIDTQLEKQLDAEQRVEYYLTTRAFPRTSLSQVVLVLSTDTVADQLRDDLLNTTISLPITISSLPPNIYHGAFAGFVEGYTWTISRNELFLTLNVSDYALSQLEMNWLQVPPSETWNTITPTLDWANARSVF